MARKPDLAFEALERVTHANRMAERGKLNSALAAIRYAWEQEGGLPEDLHEEIPRRAQAYHEMWPGITLTPTALASHWKRVVAQRPPAKGKSMIDQMRREEG